jgi:hypothetical protein
MMRLRKVQNFVSMYTVLSRYFLLDVDDKLGVVWGESI